MRIYLDSCALNRLFDDKGQTRVRLEAGAMVYFFQLFALKRVMWIAGEAVEREIKGNPDLAVRLEALQLLSSCTERASTDQWTSDRAQELEGLGYGPFDALHLAIAEQAGVDFLLTTDDRFIRKTKRGLGKPTVLVLNPINWLKEFT